MPITAHSFLVLGAIVVVVGRSCFSTPNVVIGCFPIPRFVIDCFPMLRVVSDSFVMPRVVVCRCARRRLNVWLRKSPALGRLGFRGLLRSRGLAGRGLKQRRCRAGSRVSLRVVRGWMHNGLISFQCFNFQLRKGAWLRQSFTLSTYCQSGSNQPSTSLK